MKECSRCLACHEDAEERCTEDGGTLQATLDGPPLVDRKYRLERRLSEGGMGVVYLARHVELQRGFALKLIRASDAWDQSRFTRFRLEAEALGRLEHPGIVDVTDFGIDPRGAGLPYLVMERLEGRSLDDHCRARGPLGPEEALPILEEVADAMDFAHRRGVLHRDLKPANVFLAVSPTGARVVKLLDFGLARVAELEQVASESGAPKPDGPASGVRDVIGKEMTEQPTLEMGPEHLVHETERSPAGARTPVWRFDGPLTDVGSVAGTPVYMAPERLRDGESTVATDVYSLGVLAYTVFTGRLPFEGTAPAVVTGHLHKPPPQPSSFRPALAALDEALLAAIEKDPARRPVSGAAYVRRLRRAADVARLRLWRRTEAPRRLALAAGLASSLLLTAPVLSGFGPIRDLERRTIDARFRMVPSRSPDPRLLLLTLDEASLPKGVALGTTEVAEEIGDRLDRLFAAGVRGVAIDMLCPEPWGRSRAFSDLVLRHHEALTLAAQAKADGFTGPECVQGLTAVALGPAASEPFGLVNLEEDADGVLRRARLGYRDAEGGFRPTWAFHAARRLLEPDIPPSSAAWRNGFWVDQSVDPERFPRISWKDLPHALEREPARFAGSLVLLGAELDAGDESHRLPGRAGMPRDVPGLVGQAMIADTILAGFPVRDMALPSWLAKLAGWLALTGLSLWILCSRRPGRATAFGVLFLGLYTAGALVVFQRARRVMPMAAPVVAGAVLTAAAFALTRQLPAVPRLEAAEAS